MFFGIINIGAVALGLSPLGKLLAEKISFRGLVAFQAFRLPLEIILHAWALQSVIPQTMTWSGQNLDIISGILALLIFPLANRYKNLVWIFDIVGFLLLINVMRVAVMSSPLPFAWNISPALDLAFRLPYALIGPVCVGGALAGHIILTRKLLGG